MGGNTEIYNVRIKNIEIENFKNVGYGSLELLQNKKKCNAELLGIYGQNGSGKTALIDTLSLLKKILTGNSIPSEFADYINLDSSFARLTYTFCISKKNVQNCFYVIYSCCIKKDISESNHNYSLSMDENINDDTDTTDYRLCVYDEKLSYSHLQDGKNIERMHLIIDTSSESMPFSPATQYGKLIGNQAEKTTELMVARQLASLTSRTFIFSRELLNNLRVNCREIQILQIVESLVYYGNFSLFVFDMHSIAMLSCNILPLSFDYRSGKSGVNGNIAIPINGNGPIPKDAYSIVEKVIDNMNIVLQQIVPGLTIIMKSLGTEILKSGREICRVQLFSNRNNKKIPLQYESEGIKKIVCILQLLINVYNQYSFTVAVDELDSGIFEYLLGEILSLISERGKGQLIFTSHNLRPLETLDKSCIAFTTTNFQKRYIRPINVKSTNNLRDFYYRDITLGEQAEPVYEATNNNEIAFGYFVLFYPLIST